MSDGEFRSRAAIPRGYRGYIKIANDDRGSGCYCCRRSQAEMKRTNDRVRFVLIGAGPREDEKMFLRICDGCLDVLCAEHNAIRATP